MARKAGDNSWKLCCTAALELRGWSTELITCGAKPIVGMEAFCVTHRQGDSFRFKAESNPQCLTTEKPVWKIEISLDVPLFILPRQGG